MLSCDLKVSSVRGILTRRAVYKLYIAVLQATHCSHVDSAEASLFLLALYQTKLHFMGCMKKISGVCSILI